MKPPLPPPRPPESVPPTGPGVPRGPGPESITFQDKTYTMPYANLLPPLTEEELAALREDIREHGVLVDIVVDENFEVLDGHNRLRLAAELKIEQPLLLQIVRGLTAEQKRALALNLNLHRRHLTPEQRRDLIDRHLRADPGRSDRNIGAEVGADHKTVAARRNTLTSTGEIPQSQKRRGRDGRSRPCMPAPGGPARAGSSPARPGPDGRVPDPAAPTITPPPPVDAAAPTATEAPAARPSRDPPASSQVRAASWCQALTSAMRDVLRSGRCLGVLSRRKKADRDVADVLNECRTMERCARELREWADLVRGDAGTG